MEKSIVRHILLIKFPPAITTAQYEEIIRRFRAMAEGLPGTLSFEHGENNSPEGIDRGMTHVIVVNFRDAAARDAYLVHPEHVRFSTWLGGLKLIEELVVVDFTPQPL